jgi:hypothetical protein
MKLTTADSWTKRQKGSELADAEQKTRRLEGRRRRNNWGFFVAS